MIAILGWRIAFVLFEHAQEQLVVGEAALSGNFFYTGIGVEQQLFCPANTFCEDIGFEPGTFLAFHHFGDIVFIKIKIFCNLTHRDVCMQMNIDPLADMVHNRIVRAIIRLYIALQAP